MVLEYLLTAIWIIIAVAMFIVEASTIGLVAIWFGLGAVFSAVASILNASFKLQIIVFLLSSFLLLAATRPFVKKVIKIKSSPTNADLLIGKTGTVISRIDEINGGRISISGLDWAAKNCKEQPIEVGEKVIINHI